MFTSLAHFINDGTTFTMPLIIALLTTEKIVSSLTIVLMPVVFYSGSLLLGVVVAALAERSERPGLLVGTGLGVSAAGLFGIAASLSYETSLGRGVGVLLSSFVVGLGTGFYHPIGGAILQADYGDRVRGKALGINGALGAVGRALYPSLFFAIAAAATDYRSIASLAAIGAVGCIAVSIGLMGHPSLSSRGRLEGPEGSGGLRSHLTKPLLILAIVAFVSAFGVQGVTTWMPTYLALQKGLGVTSSLGFALTGMYAAAVVGQPFFGYLVDRFEKRMVLALSIGGSAVSILCYLFSSGVLDAVLLVVLGFFTFSSFPLFLSLTADYVPRRSSSLSNALVWTLGVNGGGVVGPAVLGAVVLSGAASWPVAFEMMAAIALVATAMVALLRRPTPALNASPDGQVGDS